MEERKNRIKPQFIIVVVLIIVVLGISLAYAINQSVLNKEKQVKIDELQRRVNNLTDSIESLQVSAGQGAQENAPVSIVGPWPEYNNDIFGFNLTLSETWENYLLTEIANFIDFGFEEQNPVARISIIGHEQWNQVREQENNGLAYVGETEEFVIVYSLAVQAVDENIQSLILEFPEIMESLTLLEGELIVVEYSNEVLDEEINDPIQEEESFSEEELEEEMTGLPEEELEGEDIPLE